MNKNAIVLSVLLLGLGLGFLTYHTNFKRQSESKKITEFVSNSSQQADVENAKAETVSPNQVEESVSPAQEGMEKEEVARIGGSFVSKSNSSNLVFNFEVKQSNSPDFGKIVLMDMSLCDANAVILGAHYFVKAAYSIEKGIYICSDAAELKINGQQ